MEKKLLKVAFMYDFDDTLSTQYMQEYSLLPMLQTNAEEFWGACNDFAQKHNMDPSLAYMYTILHYAKLQNIHIKYDDMVKQGHDIKFFEGVEEFFSKINAYARTIGIEIDHYVISSGLQELISGSKIGHNFRRVFASSFAYDENNIAFWPSQALNYTTKTQYLFRIKKDKVDNLYDQYEVNKYYPDKSGLLPYTRMVYLGDGFTDIPCMKVVKDKNGTSICVYNPNKEKSKKEAQKIFEDKRVNFIAPADYRENSRLFHILQEVLNKISVDYNLSKYIEN